MTLVFWTHTWFLTWIFLVIPVAGQGDPCQAIRRLPDEDKRSQDATGTGSLCDDLLQREWYRVDYDLASTCPSGGHCGTLYPAWLKDNLPSEAEGIVNKSVCVRDLFVCCNHTVNIRVKNCGLYRVYELPLLTTSCPAAYCTGTLAGQTVPSPASTTPTTAATSTAFSLAATTSSVSTAAPSTSVTATTTANVIQTDFPSSATSHSTDATDVEVSTEPESTVPISDSATSLSSTYSTSLNTTNGQTAISTPIATTDTTPSSTSTSNSSPSVPSTLMTTVFATFSTTRMEASTSAQSQPPDSTAATTELVPSSGPSSSASIPTTEDVVPGLTDGTDTVFVSSTVPASSSDNTSSVQTDDPSSLQGQIAGIIAGGVVLLLCIAVATFCGARRCRRKKNDADGEVGRAELVCSGDYADISHFSTSQISSCEVSVRECPPILPPRHNNDYATIKGDTSRDSGEYIELDSLPDITGLKPGKAKQKNLPAPSLNQTTVREYSSYVVMENNARSHHCESDKKNTTCPPSSSAVAAEPNVDNGAVYLTPVLRVKHDAPKQKPALESQGRTEDALPGVCENLRKTDHEATSAIYDKPRTRPCGRDEPEQAHTAGGNGVAHGASGVYENMDDVPPPLPHKMKNRRAVEHKGQLEGGDSQQQNALDSEKFLEASVSTDDYRRASGASVTAPYAECSRVIPDE